MQKNQESLLQQRDKMIMEIQFIGFISDLGNNALQAFGRLKNPATKEYNKSIKQAEKLLYLLDMIQEKTRNNLTDSEGDHLRNIIGRLRQVHYEETNQRQETKPVDNASVTIRHILVDSREEAEDVLRKARDGEDFAELASLYSRCNSRRDGGLMESIKRGSLPQNVEDAAFKLETNEISSIHESVFGFHIIKMIDKQTP